MGKLAIIPRDCSCRKITDKYSGGQGCQLHVGSRKGGQRFLVETLIHAENASTGWTVLNAGTGASPQLCRVSH